jgi:hypothetical protein
MALIYDLPIVLVDPKIPMLPVCRPLDDAMAQNPPTAIETASVTVENGHHTILTVVLDLAAFQRHQYSVTVPTAVKTKDIFTSQGVDVTKTIRRMIRRVVLQRTEKGGSIRLTRSIFST